MKGETHLTNLLESFHNATARIDKGELVKVHWKFQKIFMHNARFMWKIEMQLSAIETGWQVENIE